jgi:hypothetical protein
MVDKILEVLYNIIYEEDMEILTWNVAFWEKTDQKKNNPENIEKWKEIARAYIESNKFDFILFQEINPYFIYDMRNKYENGPLYSFKNGNKNIYYHELQCVLKQEYYKPNVDIFWGAAIIANEKYTLLKRHFYNTKLEYIGKKYWGWETLMCYDFQRKEDSKIITIINFYKKGKAYYSSQKDGFDTAYAYEKEFFSDIFEIKNTVDNKNLIFFAGDFNFCWRRNNLELIEKKGFTELTDHITNTMAEDSNKSGHNDCIFVNKGYEAFFEKNKIEKLFDKCDIFSDHSGIKCPMNF